MKIKITSILTFSLIVLCAVLIFTNPFTIYKIMGLMHSRATCEGINMYFTNTNIHYDLNNMKINYKEHYSNVPEHWWEEFQIFTPEEMLTKKGYDCEDYSKSVLCLCELYNETCETYFEIEYSKIKEDIKAHSGVKIKIGENWEVLS